MARRAILLTLAVFALGFLPMPAAGQEPDAFALMSIDAVADGGLGDVQDFVSVGDEPFIVEFEVDGEFGPHGLGTFAFDVDYPEDLVAPIGTFDVNTDWSQSDGGVTICLLLIPDIGDGVARLACNLSESETGVMEGGVMASLAFATVAEASGCGELLFGFPEVAVANGGNTYELLRADNARIAVRAECAGAAPCADVTDDGRVDIRDLFAMLRALVRRDARPVFDVNGDGEADRRDLRLVVRQLGERCVRAS